MHSPNCYLLNILLKTYAVDLITKIYLLLIKKKKILFLVNYYNVKVYGWIEF